MTTKLQHSTDPLTRAPHSNFALNPLIIHHFHQESEFYLHRVLTSMDRILESRNVESMRKMILMQEQVFRQQVQELHRLYNLQKKLMHEIENGLKRQKELTAKAEKTNSDIAIRHQTATETGQSFQAFNARYDQKELSGSNFGENSRMLIKFDLETPSENAPSSIHTIEEQKEFEKIDEETDVEVELTLSIGHCKSKKRSKGLLHHCSTQFTQLQDSDQSNDVQEFGSSSTKTNKGEECGEPSSINSSYQENTRRRWLLQDLSLNRT